MARFTKSYAQVTSIADTTVTTVNHYHDYYTSAKVGGKLLLRPQVLTWQHQRLKLFNRTSGFPYGALDASGWPTAAWDDDFVDWAALKNRVTSRFTTKARKAHASLGVTLASYGQSRDMVIDRAYELRHFFTEYERDYRRRPAHRRRYDFYSQKASTVLEGFFGWAPLVSDIQAGLKTLSEPIPQGWLSARAKQPVRLVTKASVGSGANLVNQLRVSEGYALGTLGGYVTITNPNTYLANRLGLLNLPGVAWDLVPWSFVVNMFTNMGAIMSSYTDFVGISTNGINYTRTSSVETSDHWTYASKFGFSHSMTQHYKKLRNMESSVPKPTFQFKAPQFDLGLGVIALSLVVQKINSIDRLMRSAFGSDLARHPKGVS